RRPAVLTLTLPRPVEIAANPAARWKSRAGPARLGSGNRVCRPPGLNLALDDRRILILFGGRRVSFVDKTLTCSDCGQPFTFTAGEQEFHSSRGLRMNPAAVRPVARRGAVRRAAHVVAAPLARCSRPLAAR